MSNYSNIVDISGQDRIDVDIGDVKIIDLPDRLVSQAVPKIDVDENGLITATSTQETGSVMGGTVTSIYQLAVEEGKIITPTTEEQIAIPKNHYSLGDIVISPLNVQEKNIDIVDDGRYDVFPDEDYTLSKVGVKVDTSQKRAEAYNHGFEAGKQAERDAFWDMIQNYGTRTEYAGAFALWNAAYIRPKYKVIPTSGQLGSIFNNNKELLAVEKAYFDFSQRPNQPADYIVNACAKLLIFEDCGIPASCTRYSYAWRFCERLHTIEVIRSNESTLFTGAFVDCKSLENIVFDGVIGNSIDFTKSIKLTKASITNIIEHLSDTAEGKTLTLSKTAVMNAFELQEVADGGFVGTYIEEWMALTSYKSNWTITLV